MHKSVYALITSQHKNAAATITFMQSGHKFAVMLHNEIFFEQDS